MTAKAKEHAADMRLKKRPAKIATKYRKLEEKQRNAHRNKLEKQRKAYHKLQKDKRERKIRSTTLIGQPTSSSAHVPVIQTLCAQCADGGYYEFHWTEGKAYTSKTGTTGWATVTHTTNTLAQEWAVMSIGPGVRIHLCANDPCSLLAYGPYPLDYGEMLKQAKRWGIIPNPIHLREIPKFWQVSTFGRLKIANKGLLMEDVGLLGAVLFRGYLVDQEWVEKSNPLLKKELLLEPLWKLRGSAVNKKLEVLFGPGVFPDDEISGIMSAVIEAKRERFWQTGVREAEDPSEIHQPAESARWVWRMGRGQIHSKNAWVVCGGEGDVKKLVEKREAKVEKVEELKKKIEKLQEKQTTETGKKLKSTLERLVEKRDSLKEQEAKLKMMKGRPVALKKFLEEVVLPGCVLCPP
jgi:hypothetical protein